MYQECCPPNSARSSGVSIANCGAQAKCQIANNSPLMADDMSENASKETLSIACRSWTSQPQKNNSWSSKHETEYKRLFELHRLGSTSNCSHFKEAHSISPSNSAWNSKGENPRGHEVNEVSVVLALFLEVWFSLNEVPFSLLSEDSPRKTCGSQCF